MKLYRVRAVVINSREMRDAHRLLTLYSREKGRLRVVAHGASKPASRKRGAVQPFCHTEFLLRRGRDLDSVDQCEGIEIFPGLWSELELMSYAAHVAGLVEGLTPEGEADEKVFELLLLTLRLLEKNCEAELMVRSFELRLVTMLGYMPCLDGCVICGVPTGQGGVWFSAEAGGVVCPNCARDVRAFPCGGETLAVLKKMMEWRYDKLTRLRVSPRARLQLQTIMGEYLDWLMEKRTKAVEFISKLGRHSE